MCVGWPVVATGGMGVGGGRRAVHPSTAGPQHPATLHGTGLAAPSSPWPRSP